MSYCKSIFYRGRNESRPYDILILVILFWTGSRNASAQFHSDPKLGFQVGAVLNFGTHVNALGLTGSVYYTDFFYQWNVSSQLKYNFSSYGNRKMFWENRNALGLVLLGGKRDLAPDFHLDALNHQTSFSNGIAFNYLWYFDQAQTSQRSGGWGIHVNYFSMTFENDVFSGQARDKYRTGTLQANYRYGDWKFFTNLYLWTGETRNSFWNKTPLPKCPSGFRCLDSLPYGKTSHGILSFGVSRNVSASSASFTESVLAGTASEGSSISLGTATFRIGFDSEQVRHHTQNRFAHDLLLFPKKMERNTPHYPRLDENGLPVFDKSQIRKTRFYLQGSLNEVWSN